MASVKYDPDPVFNPILADPYFIDCEYMEKCSILDRYFSYCFWSTAALGTCAYFFVFALVTGDFSFIWPLLGGCISALLLSFARFKFCALRDVLSDLYSVGLDKIEVENPTLFAEHLEALKRKKEFNRIISEVIGRQISNHDHKDMWDALGIPDLFKNTVVNVVIAAFFLGLAFYLLSHFVS